MVASNESKFNERDPISSGFSINRSIPYRRRRRRGGHGEGGREGGREGGLSKRKL